MKSKFNVFVIIISSVILLIGCRALNPSVMLSTGKDFKYSTFPPTQPLEYKISQNDELSFSIFSNDGFKLVDVTTLSGEGSKNISLSSGGLNYKVEFDGSVKLPLLGRTTLKGMSVREAELFLEEKYSTFYNKPYVLLEVTNRRVIIFPGSEGSAKVVALANENTTLMEALASAGGISQSGKAYNVKLIRGDLKNPEIYLVNLSTIDGVKQSDMVLQANDIIYVEPQLRIGRDVMGEILPYLTFVTTMIIFIEFISRRTP
ncbi:MAG: polysaccharide biosynthesis/export family protein [Bacteroidota bacterium]